jgi:hypothetical protein
MGLMVSNQYFMTFFESSSSSKWGGMSGFPKNQLEMRGAEKKKKKT